MADDDRGRCGARALRRRASTCSIIGLPGHAVQHLGPRGFHPRALAGREDDDVEVGHGRDRALMDPRN